MRRLKNPRWVLYNIWGHSAVYFVARSLFGLWAFMPVAVTMTETMTNSLITNDTFLPSRKRWTMGWHCFWIHIFIISYVQRKHYTWRGSRFHPFYDALDSKIEFSLLKFLILIYSTVPIITRSFYCFILFSKTISLFSRRFSQKILSLCMVSILEQFLI